MDIKGVITGDIIGSSQIAPSNREYLLDTLHGITSDVVKVCGVSLDIFRGDSFQLIVDDPVLSLRIAVLIRAGLQRNSPTATKWDARLAIGLGTITFYMKNSVMQSDGEAFRHSGREFDGLGKSRRLAIKTPWEDLNREFDVNTAFADEIISGWTITQAKIVYPSLLAEKAQKELAEELHTSQQSISKLMISAKVGLIERYLNRYEQAVADKLNDGHGSE